VSIKIYKLKIFSGLHAILSMYYLIFQWPLHLNSPFYLLKSFFFTLNMGVKSFGATSAYFSAGYFLIAIYCILLFILGVLLLSGAYFLYKNNEKLYLSIAKINIFLSLAVFSLSAIIQLFEITEFTCVTSFEFFYINLGLSLILVFIPAFLLSLLIIWYTKNNKREIRNILILTFSVIIIIFAIPILITQIECYKFHKLMQELGY